MPEDDLVKLLLGGTGVSTTAAVWLLLQVIRLQRQMDALRIEFEYFVRESREWRVLLADKFGEAERRAFRRSLSSRRMPGHSTHPSVMPNGDEDESFDPTK